MVGEVESWKIISFAPEYLSTYSLTLLAWFVDLSAGLSNFGLVMAANTEEEKRKTSRIVEVYLIIV
jgi:hypothetical protein